MRLPNLQSVMTNLGSNQIENQITALDKASEIVDILARKAVFE